MDDDVRTVLQGPIQDRRDRGAVHQEREPVFMRKRREAFYVCDVQPGVADDLREDKAGPVVDERRDAGPLAAGSKARGNPELCKVVEQAQRPAIEAVCSDDLISGLKNIQKCHGNGRHPGGTGNRGHPALQLCNPPLKGEDRRVLQTGIGKAGRLVGEDLFHLLGALLNKCGNLRNRDQCGPALRIRLKGRM